jgi:beta-glucosidase
MGSRIDRDAIDRSEKFYFNLFAEAVFKTGDYPEQVRKEVPSAWLPTLTKEDKKRIKGSADFMATNYYSSNIFKATEREGGYSACVGNTSHVAWPSCIDHCDTLADGQIIGERGDESLAHYLVNTAGSLRGHLRWLYDEFPSRGGIYITEFGWAERGEADMQSIDDVRHDAGRQSYLRDYFSEMLLAIYKDGVPLKGAFIWSATDGVHWELGTKARFGLQAVDFSTDSLNRTYLGSFFALRDFFKKHG